MEIALGLRRLWRLRAYVAAVAVLALLASVFMTQNVSLFPPSVGSDHGVEFGAASTSLLVDSADSAIGDLRRPLEPLTARAAVVATLIRSEPVQRKISQEMGLPLGTVATIVTIPNPQNPNQPPNQTAGEQASALVGQTAAYQIAVAPVPEVPIINIATQGPTGERAITLSNVTVNAIGHYLRVLQKDKKVPTLSQVKLRKLGISGGTVNSGAGKSVALLAFFAIFIIGCLLVLAVSRVVEDIRLSRELEDQSGSISPGNGLPPLGGEGAGLDVPPPHPVGEPPQPVGSVIDREPRPPVD
jgi:hypothetical protein